MVEIIDVEYLLARYDLAGPDLELLRPTEKRYSALLLQPQGPIVATPERIGSLDVANASKKGAALLELACRQGSHLVVIPEYYLPWCTLRDALNTNIVPDLGALWVLGCASIRMSELAELARSLESVCLFLYEHLDNAAADAKLLDPVVILFKTLRPDSSHQLVAIVQFKTIPSRDPSFFEEGILNRGNRIYRFRGRSNHLSAAVAVCSDAFTLSRGLIDELIDRTTLIHIQLNPNPRHIDYRQYRFQTFQTDPKASDCHIISLNWSQSIEQYGPKERIDKWNNIGGSAWYCPVDGCSTEDEIVLPNHEKGIYYTYMESARRHALIFHYDEAVFELHVPKVITVGEAVLANKNGPNALERYIWNAEAQQWEAAQRAPDTGFEDLLKQYPLFEQSDVAWKIYSPTDIERLLALTAGVVTGLQGWYNIRDIDSFQIGYDEIVHRITVAQDKCDDASKFRHDRLTRILGLFHALREVKNWPPQVNGLNSRARLSWNLAHACFNVITEQGLPTLVVYLGESPLPRLLLDIPDKLHHLISVSDGKNKARLCILYRENGQLKFAQIQALTRIDDAMQDTTDILAVPPLDFTSGGDYD